MEADIDATRETTIEAVYREHGARMWRALRLATGSPDVASEALAEAFAQLIARGPGVRDPVAWVWRAGFKLAAGEMQRRGRSVELSDELPADAPESLVDLDRALLMLTRHQRTAVVLADYAGWSHGEIASILGSTPGAVAVHVHRARRKLKSLLEEHDV